MIKIEDLKKYANMEASDLRNLVIAYEVENNMLRSQLEQAVKERNTMFEKTSAIKLPEMPSQTKQQPQPQGQPRPAPVQPQGQPRPQPMPQPRPMPQGMPQ